MLPPIVTTIAGAREAVTTARAQGASIGFVPTMGALHEGHAALVRSARAASRFVVVSVFVNPTQFGPKEDFAKYPRTLEADQRVCGDAGADLIFAPTVEEMYPTNAVTFVDVAQLGEGLCGASRPGHFRGVCTVVLKLFNIVRPDTAHFGAKDYQQARIITQMARDLNVPVVVRTEPTVREPDGLALSSRNRYLSADERAVAPRIYQALRTVQARARAAEIDAVRLASALHADLSAIPGARVDYASLVDAETLQPVTRLDRPAVAAVAVFLGGTRLIDNVLLAE
ncbi:pantoate--beta-alanine ligase [Frigoriglobus tundricola]|uniref:Pantothenate synthetase n=1 Tax=Frigoriglobus tundricola TaxID=2774151 RepID=A0A6M5Z236_9BACT|nr:pantoate--beta-alanine ligase [Frigoriglobus tundricola]QJX00460.1 Pantoate--beta-alanine ligase [Frigoriglobus tundricola]